MCRQAVRSTPRICWWNWNNTQTGKPLNRFSFVQISAPQASRAIHTPIQWRKMTNRATNAKQKHSKGRATPCLFLLAVFSPVLQKFDFFPFSRISLLQPAKPALYIASRLVSGRSSGVEHNLAKVRVVSSNLIARSNWKQNGVTFGWRRLSFQMPQSAVFPYRDLGFIDHPAYRTPVTLFGGDNAHSQNHPQNGGNGYFG